MAALFTQALFAIGYTRAMGYVLGPNALDDALGAGPAWSCLIVGNEKSGMFTVHDTDEGAGIFLVEPAPNPAGYSPIGDLVEFRSYMATLVLTVPTSTAPLTTSRVQQGIIFAWVMLPSFPGPFFALVYVTGEGQVGPDPLVLVDPAELTLLRKNPFFP